MKTIVVTRHPSYIRHLVNIGLISPGAEVVARASPKNVRGKHVITSGLPLHLAALAARLTTVPLFLPAELRGKELSLEEVERTAQPPSSYVVSAA
jgi:hypothetical protein